MKAQRQYVVREREIDVVKMIFNALSHWRFLFIVGVICAVLVGIKQYRDDVATAQANIQAQFDAANAPEITIEYLESQLSDELLQNVKNAVNYREIMSQRQKYMDESIYINIDPYSVDVTYLTYTFATTRTYQSVKEYLTSDEMIAEIANNIGTDIEPQYIAELYSISETDYSSYMVIKVLADTVEECEKLADSIEDVLKKYSNTLETYSETDSIILKSRVSNTIQDSSLVLARATYVSEIYNNMTMYNGFCAGFNDIQMQLCTMLSSERDNSISSINPVEEEIVEKTPVDTSYIDTNVHVKPSVKMILIGFIAGVMIGFAICALVYNISKCIHGADEVKYLFDVPVLGTVKVSTLQKKKVFVAVDTMLDRLAAGRNKYLNYSQQLQLVYSNILVNCRNKQIKEVYISGSEMECVPQKLLEELKIKLEAADICIKWGKNISYDAEAMLEMVDLGACILFEVENRTKCEEIVKELTQCEQNSVNMLGLVMVQL